MPFGSESLHTVPATSLGGPDDAAGPGHFAAERRRRDEYCASAAASGTVGGRGAVLQLAVPGRRRDVVRPQRRRAPGGV